MKKVSELQGAELDYAVALAVGYSKSDADRFSVRDARGISYYMPSEDWSTGGPIIEREQLAIIPVMGGTWSAEYAHQTGGDDWQEYSVDGPTLLIAAMRAFVASRFGAEVDLNQT